jgi:Flp pilus assembly pilin Flp
MKTLVNKITAFLADEKGAETVEWVIIAAVLAGVIGVTFGPGITGVVSAGIAKLTKAIGT